MKMKYCIAIMLLVSLVLLSATGSEAFSVLGFAACVPCSRLNAQRVDDTVTITKQQQGLYRQFANLAWAKLLNTGLFEEHEIAPDLRFNQSPARGFPEGSVVDMEIKALVPQDKTCPIQYARYALLETKVPSTDNNNNVDITQSQGIQVLNLVIYPKQHSSSQSSSTPEDSAFPVWGADFVSLPGGKHLLLLDAQPMHENCQAHDSWKDWHSQHGPDFAWGGDFPPAVKRYVSPRALWTRMTPETDANAVEKIQTTLPNVVGEHLDIYLDLLLSETGAASSKSVEDSWFGEYLTYRIENDPARPMLKSLYGEEWTERALEEVLFPDMLR